MGRNPCIIIRNYKLVFPVPVFPTTELSYGPKAKGLSPLPSVNWRRLKYFFEVCWECDYINTQAIWHPQSQEIPPHSYPNLSSCSRSLFWIWFGDWKTYWTPLLHRWGSSGKADTTASYCQCILSNDRMAGERNFWESFPPTVRKSFTYHHVISQDQLHEPQPEQPWKTQPHMLDRVKQWNGELGVYFMALQL